MVKVSKILLQSITDTPYTFKTIKEMTTHQLSNTSYKNLPYLTEQALQEKFNQLSRQFIEDTAGMSSTIEMAKHPAYQEIIHLGESVIPLLLQDLQQNPLYWLTALRQITQENPVKPEQRGKVKQMAEAWLNWGKKNGYIT